MRDMGHCCEAAHSQGRVVPSSANASPGRGLTAPPVSMPDTCSNATSSWVFALGVPPSSPAHEHSRASSACSGMRLRARRAALLACPRAQQGVKRLFWHASSRSACRPPRLPTSTAGRQAPVLACVFALGVPPSSPAHEHSRVSCACSGMRLRARRAALLACPRAQQGVKRLFWHASSRSACRPPRLRTSQQGFMRLFWHASSRSACRPPRLPTSTAGRQAPVLACVFALGVPPSSPAHEHSRASSACSGTRLRAGRAALLACPRHSRASGACSGNHAEPLRWGWRPL